MKYRVLHSLASMSSGGAQAFIMNVYRNIDREQYQFDFLLRDKDGTYIDEIKKLGGRIYIVPTRREGVAKYREKLDNFFKLHAKEYDAIHVHRSSLSNIDILYYAKKYGVRCRIFHCHNTAQMGWIHQLLHWYRKPFIHSWANKYLACSDVAADWAFNWTGIKDRALEVRNGIDTELFRFNKDNRSEVRKELKIPDDAFVIGHVGRFMEVKNHTFIIDVFDKIHLKNPNSYLLLAGTGILLDQIKNKVASLNLDEYVMFLGNRTDIHKILSSIDIMLFPSLHEGLPFALVEAQSAGARVVCSDTISPEIRLSSGLKFVSLDKTADEWAEVIELFPIVDKDQMRQSVVKNGYDINSTIELLEKKVYTNEY